MPKAAFEDRITALEDSVRELQETMRRPSTISRLAGSSDRLNEGRASV